MVRNALNFTDTKVKEIVENYENDRELVTATIIRSMIKYYVYKLLQNSSDNIDRHKICTYDDVRKQDIQIVNFDEDFRNDDEFYDEFLSDRFYYHHEIQRMDSRAGYFIIQLFKAFKKNPRQLPDKTYRTYINAVRQSLEEEKKQVTGNYQKELDIFLQPENLICQNTCTYIPESKLITEEQENENDCPLRRHKRSACEGMRVIVNHIAGMTDRYTHLEYSRLYFPPEISRM
jgi:dGTP triphosphohydrolase